MTLEYIKKHLKTSKPTPYEQAQVIPIKILPLMSTISSKAVF